jgi:predicted transcriptional regulator
VTEQRRPMGSLEADVLRCLWANDGAMTPAEVSAALGTDLAYTTIMTILTRLWDKELVGRERSGRAYAYLPTLTESEYAARRLVAVLASTDDRDGALSTFVGGLSRREARLVQKLLGGKKA